MWKPAVVNHNLIRVEEIEDFNTIINIKMKIQDAFVSTMSQEQRKARKIEIGFFIQVGKTYISWYYNKSCSSIAVPLPNGPLPDGGTLLPRRLALCRDRYSNPTTVSYHTVPYSYRILPYPAVIRPIADWQLFWAMTFSWVSLHTIDGWVAFRVWSLIFRNLIFGLSADSSSTFSTLEGACSNWRWRSSPVFPFRTNHMETRQNLRKPDNDQMNCTHILRNFNIFWRL